jgi:phosphoribosylamine--glycine ligase
MRVLVVGSGAREHALVHALRRSPGVDHLLATPGNPGIAQSADLLQIAADDLYGLAEAAGDLRVDLTVIGPELPLALGVADELARRDLLVLGPSQLAAQLESSKVFAKEFCLRHGIPTADAETVTSISDAQAAIARRGLPVVLKADGLAAGKGVIVVRTEDEVEPALDAFFTERRFGDAGEMVLIEELLVGEEISYMVITDGQRIAPLATAHDYKALYDGGTGPNTGGMGSHSPAMLASGLGRWILDEIVRPVIAGMTSEGRLYRGVLYCGLMLTADGPKVLEFNCRLGDPETQSILLRLDSDLAAVLRAAAMGQLGSQQLAWRREAVACVVMAASGYPEKARKGDPISGINEAMSIPGVTVYHAGTKVDGEQLLTSGGRVLSVCGRGTGLAGAVDLAYRGVEQIRFAGCQYRTDIGADTIARMQGGSHA